MNESCQRYLEEPEANASHLDECANCRLVGRALSPSLDGSEDRSYVAVDMLPLAPWEGASHRSWPLVAAGAAIVFAVAALLFVLAGISPLHGIRGALVAAVPPLDVFSTLARGAESAVQQVPPAWQIASVVAFLVINTIFVVLLRRAPKGVDVE
jgi:hypothetical protein